MLCTLPRLRSPLSVSVRQQVPLKCFPSLFRFYLVHAENNLVHAENNFCNVPPSSAYQLGCIPRPRGVVGPQHFQITQILQSDKRQTGNETAAQWQSEPSWPFVLKGLVGLLRLHRG